MLVVSQLSPVCIFGKLVDFALGAVKTERVKQIFMEGVQLTIEVKHFLSLSYQSGEQRGIQCNMH